MVSNLVFGKEPVSRPSFWKRAIAIAALINLLLVLFDLSYVPWHDFYLNYLPKVTQLYDPIKGIELHPETQAYLNRVDELKQLLEDNELESPEVEASLRKLRRLSIQTIEDNPFALADKSRNLGKIENLIRQRVGEESAREAMAIFWSISHLSEYSWERELEFFNAEARPLMQTNYYREVRRSGQFVDYFWLIDLPFIILFAGYFLYRTYSMSRGLSEVTWPEAMLRRWYDLLLLLPFWRWLRAFPVAIWLDESRLVNIEPILAHMSSDFMVSFARELTPLVGIHAIEQLQEGIRRGDVTNWLFFPETRRPYIDINNTNEVEAIAQRLLSVSVYDVFPKIQPDLEAVLGRLIEGSLNQSPLYQQLQNFPGLNQLPTQIADNLAVSISESAYKTLTEMLSDSSMGSLGERLMKNFEAGFYGELQKPDNLEEIQSLLVDMLEEIKINYVQDIAEGKIRQLSARSQVLQMTRQKQK